MERSLVPDRGTGFNLYGLSTVDRALGKKAEVAN